MTLFIPLPLFEISDVWRLPNSILEDGPRNPYHLCPTCDAFELSSIVPSFQLWQTTFLNQKGIYIIFKSCVNYYSTSIAFPLYKKSHSKIPSISSFSTRPMTLASCMSTGWSLMNSSKCSYIENKLEMRQIWLTLQVELLLVTFINSNKLYVIDIPKYCSASFFTAWSKNKNLNNLLWFLKCQIIFRIPLWSFL